MDFKKIGKYGEDIACYYLKKKGYKILEKNYKKEWNGKLLGEIDIIVEKDKTISFVEVKSLCRREGFFSFAEPENKVNFEKKNRIIKIAEIWLNEHKIPLDSKWQIETISLVINLDSKKVKIKHFYNI